MSEAKGGMSRRELLIGAGAAAGLAGATWVMRNRIRTFIDRKTVVPSFSATPPLLAHDPVHDKATIHVGKGGGPAANVDAVLAAVGGMGKVVGVDDVVVIKVSAQWWNQGMTNVAAVKRTIEHILEIPGWKGEIVVIDRMPRRVVWVHDKNATRIGPDVQRRTIDGPRPVISE